MVARRRFLSGLFAIPLSKLVMKRGFAQGTSGATRLTLNVRGFGATGDGASKDTAAIQKAVDRCGVLGGGEVLFPSGTYLSGAIALRSNTGLRLRENAIISGSADFADYPVTQVR
jgi:polygalacturonase